MTRRVDILPARRKIEVPEGRTILEAALAEGIPYPHGCRSGRCGSCKSRLVSGQVDLLEHTRFALSDEEKAEGFVLACRALPKVDSRIAWLGGSAETADHPRRKLHCRVVALDDATHDIKRIRLAIEDGGPFAFTAGQYARLTLPGAPSRDYSMANKPGEQELEFHVRRVPGGETSTHIALNLKVGDTLQVDGPFGSSYLREMHTGPILCIAGGSGLAPIKSIVETALEHGMKQPIHIYVGARSERDLYLVDHFETLSRRHHNLSVSAVLSDASPQSIWRTGFVTDAVAEDLRDLDGWKAYVAGPPAMVDAAFQILSDRGLRTQDLHADVFFTPDEANAA
ncbi:2Fe-2S iron-sulfur cluster-binding protein [Neoaquamicrobium sediminum]|uniref:2Fe-2S iron-sulfur cluster-binding protein n=1 Tax=Neoaquamicrobium sediminum TaxID=1849104 RepID=A0ABV3WZC6_9HYPH|nr:2Fe-2S iron-sulfur cluster-binding protein [Mesorhizobium sediminum]NRC56510.1 2Fe-2S iron-sulfur cluster binding domain-containing protein [Mesorhizobium sediminum]